MSNLPTLSRALLGSVDLRRGTVVFPAPKQLDLPIRAVQFGTGAFLRGFVEYFVDTANASGAFNGRVMAVSSTGSGRDRALAEQDGLYTLIVQGIENGMAVSQNRVIAALAGSISAIDDWASVLELATRPELEVIFSNTTEVGIVLDPNDEASFSPPRSYPGKLTAFLYHRASHFDFDPGAGLIVVPCELILGNGLRLREIVESLSERWQLDDRFLKWIEAAVPFCNTLVDRIVAGTPPLEQLDDIATGLGYRDDLLIVSEPYRLFAIEADTDTRSRLSWLESDEGVVLAEDVTPYRERKVRLLNGGHTLLAPVALLIGCTTVSEAVAQENMGQLLRLMMFDEILPTVDAPGAEEFAGDVLERFGNSFIEHALWGITLHGTTKMAVRIIPSITRYAAHFGHPPASIAFGFAAFLLFMRGDLQSAKKLSDGNSPIDDAGRRITSCWSGAATAESARELVTGVCRDESLWGTDLSTIEGFADAVTAALSSMLEIGVKRALEEHLSSQLAFRDASA